MSVHTLPKELARLVLIHRMVYFCSRQVSQHSQQVFQKTHFINWVLNNKVSTVINVLEHPQWPGNVRGSMADVNPLFRKTNISYPMIRARTCAYQRVRNVRFSENLACFVFLKHPFWNLPFYLITDGMSLFSVLPSILHQCQNYFVKAPSLSIPPENRQPKRLWCFHGIWM